MTYGRDIEEFIAYFRLRLSLWNKPRSLLSASSLSRATFNASCIFSERRVSAILFRVRKSCVGVVWNGAAKSWSAGSNEEANSGS